MLKKKVKFDYVLIVCVLLLLIIGLFMVYSASSYVAEHNYGDKFFYFKKQLFGVCLGLVLMIVVSFINVEKLKKFKFVFLLVSLASLAVLFIPGVGRTSYGANRWIDLGFITIQPSEIAKFGFIFYSAGTMAKMKHNPKTFRAMLPTLLSGCATCLLIIMEPNMSITMCVGLSMVVMLFIGGASFKNLLLIAIPALCAVPILIILEPYRMQRLTAFLDPWSSPLGEGFQLIQSYYALGSGSWFGIGYGNSRQKNLFLPFAESDFIFSIIGEELGFVFCVFIILLYVIIVLRGLRIALKADTRFKCYLATGISAIIAIQTLINIAVVTGSIPPTGLPLPFISAGSTSLLVFMSAIGVVLNVDRQTRKNMIQ
ncbi:MAG: putative lipid II flippase FtsW [Clostridia bacterium]|nr:putative lipid II flippase FtsW [Clostridia bacterium]